MTDNVLIWENPPTYAGMLGILFSERSRVRRFLVSFFISSGNWNSVSKNPLSVMLTGNNKSNPGNTRKFPKFLDTGKIGCNHSKIRTKRLTHSIMHPNGEDRVANSVDPDQTAPLGAVWSGSALFAQTYLSEHLWSLRYCNTKKRENLGDIFWTAFFIPGHTKSGGVLREPFEYLSFHLSISASFPVFFDQFSSNFARTLISDRSGLRLQMGYIC